jgi:hypothetical protein
MNNLTIEQAAESLNDLVDQLKLTKVERDYCVNCIAILFATAKQTQEVTAEEEKK